MSQVNTELKKTESSTIALNDTDVRKLAKVTTDKSIIKMSDLYGKQASESVSNYVLVNSSKYGKDEKGTVAIQFPKKVISGKIKITSKATSSPKYIYNGYVWIGSLSTGNITNATKEFNIPSGTTGLTMGYYTGYSAHSEGNLKVPSNRLNATISYTVTFTGELEA